MKKKLITLALACLMSASACTTKPPRRYELNELREIREKKTEQKQSDKYFLISLLIGLALLIKTTEKKP